ncbi:MAG: bifunctional lysylphosphatidylglycerol flippase/synthetase MprF [Alphaproteobacteria bacterium]|nr:bifunctional lysylphosphatidylglycerol flippase/synthetase MprF [Alphaproteobacteria bacterium]
MQLVLPRIPKWVSPALGVALFAVAGVVVWREAHAISAAEFGAAVAGLRPEALLLAGLLTAASFACLIANESVALRGLGAPAPARRVAQAAFTAYALSNAIGFSFATAPAVRTRFYRGVVSPTAIAGVSAITGATVAAGAGLTAAGGHILSETAPGWRALGGVGIAVALCAVWLIGRAPLGARLFGTSPRRRCAAMLLTAATDWACATGVLYVLLPPGAISFPAFAVIFVGAGMAGALSGAPGGAGVFEATVLALWPGSDASGAVAALIAYRIIYTLAPLVLAGAVLGRDIARSASPETRRAAAHLGGAAAELAPPVFAALAFVAGLVLLFSSATPALAPRMAALTRVVPLFVVELSHFLASLVGVLLLIVAAGLWRRLEGAWAASLALLGAGILFAVLKGGDVEEAALLGLVAAALAPARAAFTRKSRLTSAALSPAWLLATAGAVASAGWLGFFSYRHVEYMDELWWTFLRDADASRFLRGGAGVALVLALAALWTLLSPPRPRFAARPSAAEIDDVARILETAKDMRGDAHLALLGDKELFFSASRASVIAFARRGARWIAMSEPAGAPDERADLLWRFAEAADAEGASPVFYAVTAAFLADAAQLGLIVRKIGETAIVPLPAFSLQGAARANLRAARNRAEREGATFEVAPAGSARALAAELRAVSDAWLAAHRGREKSFSLGRFDIAYLDRLPLALVRREGRICAFANIWATPDRRELSVDLMRYDPAHAPKNAMDYLFVRLMEWGRSEGYGEFDLGMAPLSGLPAHRLAPLLYRLGAAMFETGEGLYGFRGLRAFKDKFEPQWRPMYVATRPEVSAAAALLDAALLTSGGWIGLVRA